MLETSESTTSDGSPEIFRRARTAEGVGFELRHDPRGVLDLPALDDVLVCVHVGAPARLTCARGGRRLSGTAAHGDVDVVPPHTLMRWEMHDENDTTLLLNLPQALVRAAAEGTRPGAERVEIRDRFQIRDAELEGLAWAMKRETESGSPSGRLYLDALALAVAARLVARHSSLADAADRRDDGLDGRRLKRVLSFIEDRLAEDLSLESIADAAGISVSHLSALFRVSTGLPVHQYVIRRRVERAKTLLLDDGLSITEIALAAGFSHQSHMARHMKRVLGMPPRAVRRLLAEAPDAR